MTKSQLDDMEQIDCITSAQQALVDAAIEALSKLPVSADGVLVPGMTVHHPLFIGTGVYPTESLLAFRDSSGDFCGFPDTKSCYASEAAMMVARKAAYGEGR